MQQSRPAVGAERLVMYPDWVAPPAIGNPSVYTNMGTLSYAGSAPRSGFMKAKKVVDPDFAEFAHNENVDIKPLSDFYRNFEPNLKATHAAIAKFGNAAPTDIDDKALAFATDFLHAHFFPHLAGSQMMSQQEACASLEPGSSPGWPWSEKYGDKSEFLASEDYDYLHEYWTAIHHGLRPLTIFSCAGKEELRKTEKVLLGKGRGICGSPIELTVATKRYCGDMNERMKAAHGRTWSQVGMNIQSGGWDILMQRLTKHPSGGSTDNKAYDTSIIRKLFEIVRDFRWSVISPQIPFEQQRVCYKAFVTLYEDTINSMLMTPEGDVWEKLFGNPSGAANTTMDNTLVLFLALAYSWIRSVPKAECNYSSFMAHVEAGLYGDDNIFTVSEAMSSYFNPVGIAKSFAELGLCIEDAATEMVPATELSFLSNNTVTIGNVHFPVPVDGMKGLCSAAFRDTKGDESVPIRLSRICSLRQRYFFDSAVFGMLDKYAVFLLNKYKDIYAQDPLWLAAMQGFHPHKTIFANYGHKRESLLCGADQIKDSTMLIPYKNKKKKNATTAKQRRNQARAAARPANQPPVASRKQSGHQALSAYANMVAHPCDAPLMGSIFGDAEGLLARFKNRTANNSGSPHGYLLWCPAYQCFSASTPLPAAGMTFNAFGFTSPNSSDQPGGVNFAGPAWTTLNLAGFRLPDPCYNFVSSGMCQDARVVSACMRMTNYGQVQTTQGEVCVIENVPLSSVLLTANGRAASVDALFNLGHAEHRIGLDTIEVVYRGTPTDQCFRDETVAPAVSTLTVAQVPPSVANDGPRVFGFAWRNATVPNALSFELVKNIEWRPSIGSGLQAVPVTSSGVNALPIVHAALDRNNPGWTLKSITSAMSNVANTLFGGANGNMLQQGAQALLGYGMRQGAQAALPSLMMEAAPLLLL